MEPETDTTLDELSPTFPSSPHEESKLLMKKAILEVSDNEIHEVIFRFF